MALLRLLWVLTSRSHPEGTSVTPRRSGHVSLTPPPAARLRAAERGAGGPSASAWRPRRGGRRTPVPSGRRSRRCRTAGRRGRSRWPPCQRSGRLTAARLRHLALTRVAPSGSGLVIGWLHCYQVDAEVSQ